MMVVKERVLRILETADELLAVEELQRTVWPGSDADLVPVHLLVTAVHNGGLVIGAYDPVGDMGEQERLIGFVFGFPGLYNTPDGPRPKHCSHMLGVHPDFRDEGLGFALKRAQWQMVRNQGLDRITWTYDPLLSRNAHLNIAKLGAVCNNYRREVYGDMRDKLNAGLPSDRFEVDWWVNTERVNRRLSRRVRLRLDLAHFLAAGAEILNPTRIDDRGYLLPSDDRPILSDVENLTFAAPFVLVEIPDDFQALRALDLELALQWRMSTRRLFETLFAQGYLITDFIFLSGRHPRSYYVLSHGDSTL
jgi:predicted GNAT superfamily acetyltransferase